MLRASLAIGAVLFATSCSGDDDGASPGTDGGGTTALDAGGSDAASDAGSGVDSGAVSCVSELADAASGAGCNGGFQGEPSDDEPGGRCELGTDARPAGSCTTERAICMGDSAGSGEGWCVIGCAPPATPIDAQTCPTGYRCFRQGSGTSAFGLCYRDCDAEHPCQDGWTCNDSLGRCEETPPT